jgi:glutathione S-transferase
MENSQKEESLNTEEKEFFAGAKAKETKISKDIDKSKIVKVYTFESNSAGGILCVLIYAKAQFVIKKLDVEDWDLKKQKFDYEALPIIKINKVQYTHEIPIILYLGRKYNLLGDKKEDIYIITNLLYSIFDLKEKILPAFLPESKEEYENQQINIDKLLYESMPVFLQRFETLLEGKDYFLGKKISVIDLYMCFFIFLIFKHPLRINLLGEILIKNAPNLDNLTNSLIQNELKEYFSSYFEVNSPL